MGYKEEIGYIAQVRVADPAWGLASGSPAWHATWDPLFCAVDTSIVQAVNRSVQYSSEMSPQGFFSR